MGIVTAVRGLARFEGILRLPGAAVAALKPLNFYIYIGQKTEMPEAFPGARFYADGLDRLREHRSVRKNLPNEFWRDQINGARYCSIAEKDGQLAGVIWLYDYPAKRPFLVLAPGDAEISAAYILPEFRGCSLYRPLGFSLREWWLDSRGGRVFGVAAATSPATLSILPRNGYVHVATLHRNSYFGPRFHTAQVPHDEPHEVPQDFSQATPATADSSL